MKAVLITQPGAPEVLKLQEYAEPKPGDDEVLIKVKAAGLNRADVAQRQGNYPPPPGAPVDVPGMEVSGVVTECGIAVTMWKPGDEVCALIAGGGYAEYVAVKEGQCLPVPGGISLADAAGLPETIFTVWSNVFQRGSLQPGENLLVHGGSSGIGITAIQLAHAFGSRVFVTVGSEDKGKACLELGANKYINYRTQDFEQELKSEGVDVILDMIGGAYFSKNINILNPGGRLVYINFMKGKMAELDLAKLMQKRLLVTGSTLRGREYGYKKALAEEILLRVWPLFESGEFKPVTYKTFSFNEAAEAHMLMESSDHIGKIILVNENFR
ncbi:NAD(P)H-quinone oxidoreductase [Danxiaibacter flavus]|uniref:NAD(P)H-quinone oxidoreductase n=1 Tax=Danxiaibacter flavus TaxID=3049108 RepID=A0ABV3ZI72_9BACT|nr:NAD(P)H-quinone oxidoreductase [Chitinophagaceae bacterium DXS]